MYLIYEVHAVMLRHRRPQNTDKERCTEWSGSRGNPSNVINKKSRMKARRNYSMKFYRRLVISGNAVMLCCYKVDGTCWRLFAVRQVCVYMHTWLGQLQNLLGEQLTFISWKLWFHLNGEWKTQIQRSFVLEEIQPTFRRRFCEKTLKLTWINPITCDGKMVLLILEPLNLCFFKPSLCNLHFATLGKLEPVSILSSTGTPLWQAYSDIFSSQVTCESRLLFKETAFNSNLS